MANIYFKETQRFNQWWIRIALAVCILFFCWALYQQLVLKIPFGSKPASDLGLIIISLITVGIVVGIPVVLRLETTFNEEGIEYRYFPFHFRKHSILWLDVKEAHIRTYRPILEYGGWGIKYGLSGGKAYNVSGNKGLQLELRNGGKVLFGTQKPGEIEELLEELKRKKLLA